MKRLFTSEKYVNFNQMHSCCLKITSEQLLNEVLFILFWQTVRIYGSNLLLFSVHFLNRKEYSKNHLSITASYHFNVCLSHFSFPLTLIAPALLPLISILNMYCFKVILCNLRGFVQPRWPNLKSLADILELRYKRLWRNHHFLNH